MAARENVEVGVYNPVTPTGLFKLNYRMHDKYLLIDDRLYLLGGRNSNDIFLGRQDLRYQRGQGYLSLRYLRRRGRISSGAENIFSENMGRRLCGDQKGAGTGDDSHKKYTDTYTEMEERYSSLKEKYKDIEIYHAWEQDTLPVNTITLLDNGTQAGRKTPQVLQAIRYLSENARQVMIQTPYVICNSYMYEVLEDISDHAQLQILSLMLWKKALIHGAVPIT